MFHETIPFSRESIFQVLETIQNNPQIANLTQEKREELFSSETFLGSRYIKSIPKYAMGCGLISQEYEILSLGFQALSKDSLLNTSSTQWLMHYHLSAPQGPGPLFWHELVKTRFRVGQTFTGSEIAAQIAEIYQRESGSPLAEKSARSTATIFLGTYTKPDGLANLNLLIPIGEDRYQLNDDIDPPPTWVVAYAILDHWQAYYPTQKTINMDDLVGENGVSNIFMIGAGKVANILQKMQLEGLVDVFRAAPPYQVVLLKPELDFILQKIYAPE